MSFRITLFLLLFCATFGCDKGKITFGKPPSPEDDPKAQTLRRQAEIAMQLLAKGDVVAEVSGSYGDEKIHFVRPGNQLIQETYWFDLIKCEAYLQTLPKTNSLVILIVPAYGFTMEPLTNAVRIFEKGGFTNIELVASGWGMHFPVPREEWTTNYTHAHK